MNRFIRAFFGVTLITLAISTVCFVFVGCFDHSVKNSFSTSDLKALYKPKYANGFGLYGYGNSTILKINKPWQGDLQNEIFYFFSRNGELPPKDFQGITINLPLTKVISMSTSYTAFIEKLEAEDAIKGVSGAQFIYSENIRERVRNKQIRDVGYESGLNYEMLVDIAPDVMFIYGVSGENSVITDKVKELGINAVYLGDYLENSPLGRAEWIVVMGELFGKRQLAETIFDDIAQQYNEVKSTAADCKTFPKVMLNAPWRDTWFVPGDKSYVVQLIKDASGDYICKGEDNDKSRPISSESAYIYATQADVWLNPGNANTIDELLVMNPNFAKVPAVFNAEVYNNNARQNDSAGSDFWESGVVSPHIVLKDMIKILHPDLLPDYTLYYFQQLK